jgi:hypothetical protein
MNWDVGEFGRAVWTVCGLWGCGSVLACVCWCVVGSGKYVYVLFACVYR